MATNNAINQHKPIPLFFAYMAASTGAVTGDGTTVKVPYDSTLFNDGSFNTATYEFIAPSNGIYLLNTGIIADNANGKTSAGIQFYINGVLFNAYGCNPNLITVGGSYSKNVNCIVEMTAAQSAYLIFYVAGGAKNCAIISAGAANPRTWFSATLIG